MSSTKPYTLPGHPLLKRQNDGMGTKILTWKEQNVICFLITSVLAGGGGGGGGSGGGCL